LNIQRPIVYYVVAAVIFSFIGVIGLSILDNCLFFGCPIRGDYGDAPDQTPAYPTEINGEPTGYAPYGFFPTLYENNGAHTLSGDEVRFGPRLSIESGAEDDNDPDGRPNLINEDNDDGIQNPQCIPYNFPSHEGPLKIWIISPDGGTFYLNSLVDEDRSGSWTFINGSTNEWIIRNKEITLGPNSNTYENFPYPTGKIPEYYKWFRGAITTEKIPYTGLEGWSGTGEFASGEIEDYLMEPVPPENCLGGCSSPFDPTCLGGGIHNLN